MIYRAYRAIADLRDALFKTRALSIPEDSVILVLDLIRPYEYLWNPRKSTALWHLLAIARTRHCRVVFTRWVRTKTYPDDALTARGSHWTYQLPDRNSELLGGFYDDAVDEIVDVTSTNALQHLSLKPTQPVILCGMWTESCVINTARAAVEDNHAVYVYRSACAGHFLIDWYALWAIQALYATVFAVST